MRTEVVTRAAVEAQSRKRAERLAHERIALTACRTKRFQHQHGSRRGQGGAVVSEDAATVDLPRIGPRLERHPAFTKRANVHFVQVHSRAEATMRTWERGSGITMACGTGASAVLVAGAVRGRLDRSALIHLPGGDLTIQWDSETNHVFMTGPAEEVFEGVIPF